MVALVVRPQQIGAEAVARIVPDRMHVIGPAARVVVFDDHRGPVQTIVMARIGRRAAGPGEMHVVEAGGTQVHYISSVPFEKLGLPPLPKRSFAQVSEGIQHTLYKNMIAPVVLFAGLAFFAWRNARKSKEKDA